jgi:hypothetical protein
MARQRSMFSSTTMASSTTIPMASTSPNNVRLLRVNPVIFMMNSVPTSDTPTSMSGKMSDFQSCNVANIVVNRTDHLSVADNELPARADVAVEAVSVQLHAHLAKRSLPGEHVGVDGIHQRSIQVKHQRVHGASLPRLYRP